MTTPLSSDSHILTRRIIPGLKDEHRLVAMPYWAWHWLEDFMKVNRISYQGIYDVFAGHTAKNNKDISDTLLMLAELHHEQTMREAYHLANDNEAPCVTLKYKRGADRAQFNLPRIYKLFGFMPCATTLKAVWERRHARGTLKVN